MSGSLQRTYNLSKKIFPDIDKICNNCNTCCKTYGWLLNNEAEYFFVKGCPTVIINNSLHCIDSFKRDISGKIIIDQIPCCKFYKEGQCSINSIKPLDCRLYPIKVKFDNKQALIGLSLGCKYISSLSQTEKDSIYKNVVNFFNKAPKKTINSYLNLMYKIHLITQTKRFWMKKLLRATEQNGKWKLYSLNI